MTLNQIKTILNLEQPLPEDISFDTVTEDSRRVQPGALFVAVSGTKANGHAFTEQAVQSGAVAIIGDRGGVSSLWGVPYISVPEARKAAALLAHALAGNPTERMQVLGITGTNGKTSTARMTQSILKAAGHPTACLGTLGYDLVTEEVEAPHTTPFGEELAALFARAEKNGATHAVMEVSSHALEQERVAGIKFRGAAFTNLTQDHLDYHGDMDSYRAAKLKLFERLEGADAFGVVNIEDPSAQYFRDACKVRCITYGAKADVRATHVRMEMGGAQFKLHSPWGDRELKMRMLGKHNVSNALCAAALAGGLGVEVDAIADGLAALENVPGRFESIDCGQSFFVIVDYAHTDDGLKNVLTAARTLCRGNIICVFGCGGDRDKTKRPKMGNTAASMSDFAILTSDNPRTEDPVRILLDVEVGVQRSGKKKDDDYLVIENREEAIRRGIGMAKPGDLVLIAGKGHEDYQIIGTTKHHFDDREMARAVLGGT